jgi:prostaglandin-H2 D-isomerase / glutathione transferase
LALAAGGIPFKDTRLSQDEFAAMIASGGLPFAQLPVLVADGTTITQSSAILRFCGKLAGLYPGKDDVATAKIDEVTGIIDDVMDGLFKHMELDKSILAACRDTFNTTLGPRLLGGLEGLVSKNTESDVWMCGSGMTIADLVAYYSVGNIKHGFVDHVPNDTFDKYPRIMASYNAVCNHPKLVAWHKAHPW